MRSMSHVEAAIGRTTAASGAGGPGTGTSCQRRRPPGAARRARMRSRVGLRRCRVAAPVRPGARSCSLGRLGAMRAVTIREGEVVIEEHPDPEPGAGEVLVQVRAAGLNGADMMQRRGLYPAPPGSPPDIPGLEMAGEVIATGPGCERLETGDRVMAVVGGGGQAERCVVHERAALRVPESRRVQVRRNALP